MIRQTVFSPCRRYRYTLWREWIGGDGFVAFIGLNPSTADEVQDDPTIRRCIGYAKRWGYGAMCMLNLFAFRATDPRVMKAEIDPIGRDNDLWISRVYAKADRAIAAWGTDGEHMGRADQVVAMLPPLHCLRITKHGHPAHPLYLPSKLNPIPLGGMTT